MDGVGAMRDVKSGTEGESGFGETGMIRGASGAVGDNGRQWDKGLCFTVGW